MNAPIGLFVSCGAIHSTLLITTGSPALQSQIRVKWIGSTFLYYGGTIGSWCELKRNNMNRVKIIVVAMLLCLVAACTSKNNTSEDGTLYRIMVGEKYGFMDVHGNIAIEPQFDYANLYFTDGLCFVTVGEKKGFVDTAGIFVCELGDSVAYTSVFAGSFARISCGYARDGIVNKNGAIVVPATHYSTGIIQDGDSVYLLIEDWKSFYIADKNGDTIGTQYDSILGFHNGLWAVKIHEKWGYVDVNGNMVIDTIYDYARTFSEEGIARVRQGKTWYYIDKSGKQLFSVDSSLSAFRYDRAAVVLEGKKCLVNGRGEKVCSIDADEFHWFDDGGLATIIKAGKASKIDTMGNVVISTNYDYIGEFIGGVAPVKKDDKWGFIDSVGNEIVAPTNDEYIYAFHEDGSKLRAVQSYVNGAWGLTYYDLQGNIIWKDAPMCKKSLPYRPDKNDFVEYFDSRIAELDPIEGIYYVTNKQFYQNRNNPNVMGTNGSSSKFYAVVKDDNVGGFMAHCTDGTGMRWVNKFVRIGETNSYAIMKIKETSNFSSEGKVTIEDPSKFEFQLDQGDNGWYNFYITYEFVKDYPPASAYDMVRKAEWSGTGFAIADGYIVTNYHVTNGANTIRIRGIDGNMKKSYKGYVVASDKEHDLSVVKVVDKDFEGLGSIPYTVGKVGVEVGDEVFVLGYPMTTSMGEEIKLTDGIVSAASGFKGDESMYQISAAVQPGNSGGPLFNSDGTVIGVVCAKHAEAENANYAVKVSYLYSLVANSDLGIDIVGNNKVKAGKLSKKVKKVKNYVYLIECSSM